MSGYRRVNYYELCRLCTSSEGTKMHIFREEGRRRQLPSKIQLCLPLQVLEDDSLPKIICSQCAEKLEHFYEFRNSCVNAEAMLESYFTSLRYSEDFIREGKVYVKDESPKKKSQPEAEKPVDSLKVPNVQTVASIPVNVNGLNNLVQTTSIQIVSHPEQDCTRLPQYKCAMEMQPTTVVEQQQQQQQPVVRYSYQTCTSMAATNTTSNVTLLKTEDSTQTDYHKELSKQELNQNHQPMDQGTTTYYVRVPSNVEQECGQEQTNDGSEVVESEAMHQTITFAPNHGQDMLVHFGFNKEPTTAKDQAGAATILRTDDRTSIAQIGEFLRMKTVVVEEEPSHPNEQETTSVCEQCGKELNTPELQANHPLTCPGTNEEKNGGSFACEICGKPFKRKEHLFQHRKLHTGERPYACNVCGKAFSRKEHLVRHAVSHTGQKVHSCDMCTKSFSRKDNLHKHRKTHGIAGPYVCETCGKSFVVKHYYLMHKTTHTSADNPDEPLPYRCDICYKGFSVKQYLLTHKLRHRGKNALTVDSTTSDGEEGGEGERDPLSTVNTAAILPLAPNVIHHGGGTGGPLYQVTTGANTTYLTTAATTNQLQLIENYRRLHS